MSKGILAIGICFLLLFSAFIPISVGLNVKVSKIEQPSELSNGNTLYVGGTGPGNYTTIQDAVNDSNNGDTIFVYSGIYPHNVWIDKSISLIGENKANTIIEGGWGTLVIVDADAVLITGFTVRDCGFYYVGGIHILNGCNNVTVKDNILTNNLQCGISNRGNYNKIENNIIKENPHGIKLAGDYNKITGNVIDSNNQSGIYFVWLRNGKSDNPIYSYNEIKDNVIKSNSRGIDLENCNNTLISYNLISNNKFTGIFSDYHEEMTYKNNTKIEDNTILYNRYGIFLLNCNRTTISDNIISLNNWSVIINDCDRVLIYHNNFGSNKKKPYDENYFCEDCVNQWDDGYPSGGNFWSDYSGSDNFSGPDQTMPGSDGIGDVAYKISGNLKSKDRYPLMEPWGYNPPRPPDIDGPTHGKVGIRYYYTFNSSDSDGPDGDGLIYIVSWGDGSPPEDVSSSPSGEGVASHIWNKTGNYIITAYAEDVNGLLSGYGLLEVTMPRSKTSYNSYLLRFFDMFLILQRMLSYIL